MMDVVLVRLPGGAGVVRRRDGSHIVTDDVADGRGTYLRDEDPHHPVKSWVDEDRSVVGGLLPPGAVSAEVVDDLARRVEATVGGGAYVALIAQPNDGQEPIVCCRDQDGRPVRRPLPAEYPSDPVTDTDVRCPACGAVDYEEYFPTEQWRGGSPGPAGTTVPNPVVVCRTCGQEEREGTFVGAVANDEGEDERLREERITRAKAAARVQRWYAETMLLRSVSFPIYAAEGWPARIGGSASSGEELTEITICHHDNADAGAQHRIEVITSIDKFQLANELQHARETLEVWVANNQPQLPWCGKSHAAVTLWLAAHHRQSRGHVLAARRTEQFIIIDGTPQPFLTLTASTGSWVAVRTHQDLMITIAGHDLDPRTLTVEPVADPAGQLLGPKPPDLRV